MIKKKRERAAPPIDAPCVGQMCLHGNPWFDLAVIENTKIFLLSFSVEHGYTRKVGGTTDRVV